LPYLLNKDLPLKGMRRNDVSSMCYCRLHLIYSIIARKQTPKRQTDAFALYIAPMKLIFASSNENKAREIRSLLPAKLQLLTMKEAGFDLEIEEPHDTMEANASEKSRILHELLKENVFSEDSGLEVFSLNNEPGVKSARYAGEQRDMQANIDLLLQRLKNTTDRKAQFKTVISLMWAGKEHQFVGLCSGNIVHQPQGDKGFGYDPIFMPDGATKTFGDMSLDEKNGFSHRKKALAQMLTFLDTLLQN
jgi:XTP/dITP diphosphohydrolase